MIPAERSHLHVSALSHPGMSGKNNEDRYAVSAFRVSQANPLPSVFAIISDGIGGHNAGEVAAEIAVDTISQQIAASDATNPVNTLEDAVIQASQAILAQSEDNPELLGMGATCACCWVIDDRLYVAHVGDSRTYLLRGDTITQLSTDHTWIQEAMDAGLLTPEELANHPNTHVIRRYLGSKKRVVPDMRLRLDPDESPSQANQNQGLKLLPGDQILLCSDGLTDLVSDEEIQATLRSGTLEEALKQLIAKANERGGHDNITTIALGVPTSIPHAEFGLPGVRRWKPRLACLVTSLFIVLVAALFLVAYLFSDYILQRPFPTPTNTPYQQLVYPTPDETLKGEVTSSPTPTEPAPTSTAGIEPTLTPWPVTPAQP